MVETRYSRVPLALLFSLMSVSAVAAEKKDFAARWKEAEKNVKHGAGKHYFNEVFFKEFYGMFGGHSTECAQQTGEKMMGELNAAVEIGARGQVLTFMARPESEASKAPKAPRWMSCFADLVKRDTFSAPPSDHFWIPMTLSFTGN